MKSRIVILFALTFFLFVSCNEKPKEKTSSIVSPEKDSTTIVLQPKPEPEKSNSNVKRKTIKSDQDKETKMILVKKGANKVNRNFISAERAMDSLYKALSKAPEVFVVDNSKDTILVCAEGTKITVSANCFIDKNKKKISGKINLEVREYYSTSDMLLASLNSVSDGNLMESSGMLNLQASSNGAKLNLSSKKTIKVEMPAKKLDPSMELFYGQGHDRKLNWKKSKTKSKPVGKEIITYTTFRKASFTSQGVSIVLDTNGRNRFLRGEADDTYFRNEKALQHLKDTVVLSFEMDAKGRIKKYKLVLNNREIEKFRANAEYYKENRLLPGGWSYRDAHDDISFGRDYQFEYDIQSKAFYRGLPYYRNRLSLNEESLKKIKKAFKQKTDTTVWVTLTEVYIHTNAQIADKYIKERLEKNIKDSNGVLANNDMKYYVYNLNNLGWINCDRFYNTPDNEKTVYSIAGNELKNEDVKIVFTDIKSIMQGINYKGNVSFNNVPKDMDIAVIGIRYRNSKYELATSKTTTSDKNSSLQYFPMSSITEIKDKIAALTGGN